MSTPPNISARSGRALWTVELAALGVNIFVALAMMLVVVYGVIMRYIFNVPVRWVAEVSEFMMVALTFLALGYVQRERKHITIDFFFRRQSAKTKAVLSVITTSCSLMIFALLAWAGWKFALAAYQSGFVSDAAAIPLFPPRLLVPLGAGVMCLQLVADLVRGIGSLWSGKAAKEA